MNEAILDAERQLEKAAAQLGNLPSSASLSRRQSAESAYGRAYQRLVRLGARRQLRTKYRGK